MKPGAQGFDSLEGHGSGIRGYSRVSVDTAALPVKRSASVVTHGGFADVAQWKRACMVSRKLGFDSRRRLLASSMECGVFEAIDKCLQCSHVYDRHVLQDVHIHSEALKRTGTVKMEEFWSCRTLLPTMGGITWCQCPQFTWVKPGEPRPTH